MVTCDELLVYFQLDMPANLREGVEKLLPPSTGLRSYIDKIETTDIWSSKTQKRINRTNA